MHFCGSLKKGRVSVLASGGAGRFARHGALKRGSTTSGVRSLSNRSRRCPELLYLRPMPLIESSVPTSSPRTGPRTAEGKAKSATNARTHGLLSRAIVLPDESQEDFDAFEAGLVGELAPVGAVEYLLVARIVACAWRLRRVLVLEAGVFEVERPSEMDDLIQGLGSKPAPQSPFRVFGRSFIRAGNSSADPFSKLSRYETTLERSLYRALHELQRVQAGRSGQRVPLPAVLDVDIAERSSTP